jgi:hypothetical protein
MRKSCLFVVFVCSVLFPARLLSQEIDSVLFLSGNGASIKIPSTTPISPQEAITISVWIKPTNAATKNREETIVSKTPTTTVANFSQAENWDLYDATNQNGSNDVKGFVGGVFDGRYIYCSPWWKGETQSGTILRYDTHGPYQDSLSWSTYDASDEDGVPDIRGLEGAVFDGRFVYFVPLHRDGNYFGTVLRYDTQKSFLLESSWEVFNAEPLDPEGTLKGFVGAVFDGQHVYFIPNPFEPHGKVLRLDTKEDFLSENSWSIYDLGSLDDQLSHKGFFGGVFDGKYLYFVPYNVTGTIVRYDTEGDFLSDDSWTSLNLSSVLAGNTNNIFAGAAFDGRYIYLSPSYGGKVVRFDTSADFFDHTSWRYFEALNLDGENDVQGGVGPTFDGRFVYFPPMYATTGRSGKFFVYDTQKDFNDRDSWNWINMAEIDPQLKGFEGSVFDGKYLYFMPMNFEESHGKILRYNTVPGDTIGYSLQYTRGSSSFGSVPAKISFKLETQKGMRSIFLSGNPDLANKIWHHVAVTYDGFSLRLYLDGVLNNSVHYADQAFIVTNKSELYIGNMAESVNHGYQGYINDLSIWDKALTAPEITAIIPALDTMGAQHLRAYWSFNNRKDLGMFQHPAAFETLKVTSNSIELMQAIFAGENESICRTAEPYQLTGFFPGGGVWEGTNVNENGLFTPSSNLSDSIAQVTYSITRHYGAATKTFKAFRRLTYKTPPEIISSQESICANAGVTLSVDGTFSEYLWSNGESSNELYLEAPGQYTVTVTDDGCELQADSVTVIAAPVPEIQLVDFVNLRASIDSVEYEWSRNGTMIDNDTQSFVPYLSGYYQVRAIQPDGCVSEFSQPKYSPGLTDNVTVFPNKSSGPFRVAIGGLNTEVTVNIIDPSGMSIYQTTGIVDEAGTIFEIDLSDRSSGLYVVRIQTPETSFSRKIVINK